jgi:spore coat polysaccharide biosynthesis protein SpsF
MKSVINIVTVIQARMNSSRLPYKVMMSLAEKPLLLRLVERVKESKLSGCIVVATTTDDSDNPIYELCKKNGINVFRGHTYDLLDRHYKAGLKYDADVVVKIPSDCPLIDPAVITRVIKKFIDNQDKLHYVSNLHPATYPDGNDVEAISMEALSLAWRNARKPHEREHTTPYIWDNPDLFNIANVSWETGWDYSMTHRWTIDYEDDYFLIKRIYDELYNINPDFNMYDILALLENKTELKKINSKYAGVNWYRNHLKDLNTISSTQTRFL